MIEIEPGDAWLIDCPLFQRMRHVRQTGFTYLTYPNAQHTRFEHSLGVYFVAKRLLATFRRTKEAFEYESRRGGRSEDGFRPTDYPSTGRPARLLLHAALLHDVGHAAFSHVTERLFAGRADRLTIGEQPVSCFREKFREFYELVDSSVQTGRRKPLAELLTVAIITCSRFERFYSLQPGREDVDPFVDLCDISALVLGDRIEQNDFALPELLSGPVDADKIDYMIRDAHACGISIGVDVARIFVRAGVYEGSAAHARHLELKGYNPGLPIKLFVIEQSGTDAVRELGSARLSLYERVYNHQLTRGAQAAFDEMILQASSSSDPQVRRMSDFLTLWHLPEDVVLSTLRFCSDPKCKVVARSLLNWQLPKRGGCFGREFLRAPEASIDLISTLQDAYEERLQDFSDKVLLRLADAVGEELKRQLLEECRRIKQVIAPLQLAGVDIPGDESPQFCRLLAYPQMRDLAPPPALITRAGIVERFGDGYFSYLYAGETSSQIGYVLVSDEWREITIFALQTLLYKRYGKRYEVHVPAEEPGGSNVRLSSLTLEAIFRPILNLDSVGRQCKVSMGKMGSISNGLAGVGYFDASPQLLPCLRSAELEEIAERFSEFSGEQGWRVKTQSVIAFVSQFSEKHRREIIGLLLDKSCFLFLNRADTIRLVVEALNKLEVQRPLRLVPLTPSSGQNIRNHIRSVIEREGVSVHASLSHALSIVDTQGGSVVFLDDNIASGTQASRQLDIYFGAEAEKAEGNYAIDPLDDRQKDIIRKCDIGAAFAIGYQSGREAFARAGRRHGLQLSEGKIVWGRPVNDVSGKGVVSDGLRSFLREIGEMVLRRRFEREAESEAPNWARERALGYADLEGLAITSFSVPTSTYPGLWCPGIRCAPDGKPEEDIGTPWIPLFLRTGMLKHLVLG